MTDKAEHNFDPSGPERISRLVVAIVTCLGALGLAALVYFPLHYLK